MWNFWQKRNLLNYALLPFSYLFLILVLLRKWLHDRGIIKKTMIAVPIIVVGNITVGGSGKTSFVMLLANFLQNQGFNVGIISKGYGSNASQSNQVCEVEKNSEVSQVGDEPLMMKRSNLDLAVFVSKNRSKAAKECLKKRKVDIIISDDGLQHYQMHRDLEIVLNDENHNGYLLPSGPLREPIKRLKEVDFVIESNQINYVPIEWQSCFSKKKLPLDYFNAGVSRQALFGFVGIAKNKKFQTTLENLGIKVNQWSFFKDHHLYQKSDFVNLPDNAIILTSQKDSVKFKKEWFKENQQCYFLKSELQVDQKVIKQIWQKINTLITPMSDLI